ncbi:MAG TPA: AraC family transcriptional regulator [Acidimicrobiia bacterium]|jgi:PAS domain S-box-containing protein|nr:AraC family transcriptional regulator [Actinomycetota bacterium]HIG25885.1 AraC family transcriptional regulator [Acidimicrobiia bacterium]HIL46798.1 AraC family transcriptional regulator [Acidimicrobiia bacterium]
MTDELNNQSLFSAGSTSALVELFDALPHVMFCMKGADDRYLAVNDAFVRRSGRTSKREVIGARAIDLFPTQLAERYEEQDALVLATGEPLRNELELIRRPDGSFGWYMTVKLPVMEGSQVSALVSVSRDLATPSEESISFESLTRVVELVQQRLSSPLRVADLAEAAGCSEKQLERRMKKVFGLSATQYVLRVRVDRATSLLLNSEEPIASVAVSCGFYDQASFTRQFARLAGETPARFRTLSA